MAVQTPVPSQNVNAISGESISVHLLPVPGAANEVIWRITRNGAHSDRYSLTELQQVVDATNRLLAQARGRSPVALAQQKQPPVKPPSHLDKPGGVPIRGPSHTL